MSSISNSHCRGALGSHACHAIRLPGKCWGLGLFVSGAVPALFFGVAVGNVLQGVPFRFDDTLRMTYELVALNCN
jgi:hypothetical protein